MVSGARAVARQQVRDAMVALAREQLATAGPAGLSLRAIARDLDMPSSGIYRYFRSRDELLTALLVEVYLELGRLVQAAGEAAGPDPADRFRALAHALRSWALTHPYDWALLYGSPVPGYAAPADTIGPAATVTWPFMELMTFVQTSDAGPNVVPGIADYVQDVTSAQVIRGIAAGEALMGAISMELFGHFGDGVSDFDVLFSRVVDLQIEQMGMRTTS